MVTVHAPHPASRDLLRGVALTAWAVFGLVITQFALAGAGLFASPGLWALHGAVGGGMVVPLGVLLVLARKGAHLAPVRRAAWLLLGVYVLQVMLAGASQQPGMVVLRAVHVANASVVLCCSFLAALRASQLNASRPAAVAAVGMPVQTAR